MSIADRGDDRPRVLGWTVLQWSLVAANLPGMHAPTYEGALALRKAWLVDGTPLDLSKRDDEYAHALFSNVRAERAIPFPQPDCAV